MSAVVQFVGRVPLGVDERLALRSGSTLIDARHVEHRVGRDEPVLDRPRQRDELVRRARLEQLGERRVVLARRRDTCAGLVGDRAVHRRHREHVAGRDVDDRRHAALGLRRRTWSSSEYSASHCRSSSIVSTTSVPRLRVDARLGACSGMSWPCGSCSTTSSPGLPVEQRVVQVLDAVEALAVGADVPEERAAPGCRPDSSAPTRARSRCPGSWSASMARRPRSSATVCARYAKRGAAVADSCFSNVVLVDVQDRRELGGGRDRVGDERRVGVHRRTPDRHREVAAVRGRRRCRVPR